MPRKHVMLMMIQILVFMLLSSWPSHCDHALGTDVFRFNILNVHISETIFLWNLHGLCLHTHTTVLRPFVLVYPCEPIPEKTFIHSHPSCSSTILIIFLHLPRTMASSLLNPRTWQSFLTTSNHVLFVLPLGLEPSTSYSMYVFSQSLSSFRNICPYHRNLCVCCY